MQYHFSFTTFLLHSKHMKKTYLSVKEMDKEMARFINESAERVKTKLLSIWNKQKKNSSKTRQTRREGTYV